MLFNVKKMLWREEEKHYKMWEESATLWEVFKEAVVYKSSPNTKSGLSSLKNCFTVYPKGLKHIDEIKFPAYNDILIAFHINLLDSLFSLM